MTSRLRSLTRATLLALTVAACVPRRDTPPTGGPVPEGRPRTTPPAAERGRSFEFAYAAGSERYTVTTQAEIEAAEEPGSRQSSGSLVVVTYEFPRDVGAEPVFARIDSFAVRSSAGEVYPLAQPLRFDFSMAAAAQDDTSAMNPVDCERPDATLRAIARSALPAVPAVLAPGTRWRDSVAVSSCRGGIPILVITVSEYRVDRPGSSGSLLPVQRTSRISITSAGGEAGSRWITGSGTAEGQLLFDVGSGRLESGMIQSRTTLTLDAPGQVRTFRQQAVQEIRRIGAP